MSEALGRLVGFVLTIIIGIFALGGVRLTTEKRRREDIRKAAEAAAATAKEETRERIQDTDPHDLVSSDADPATRSAERDSITNGFRQRVRDRSRQVVSRHDGS